MKVSDLLAEWLKGKVDHVFGLQGGAAVHIFDSCERIGPRPIYCHHEQAAGFAASAYARVRGFGVCITTTGPAATNAVTPLLGAWQDFIPVMFISGQQRSTLLSYGTALRQTASQEAPILDVVRKITKHAVLITKEFDIREVLNTAYGLAVAEPSGPVWIDLPVDVQWQNL